MKRLKLFTLILCAVLLCACSASEPGTEQLPGEVLDTVPEQETAGPVEPVYAFEEDGKTKFFLSEDSGRMYASYSYHVPMMYIANLDELSEEARALAQQNVDAFNTEMRQVLDDAVAFGEDLVYEEYEDNLDLVVVDEKERTASQTGQIITVLANGYYHGGGAHPNVYTDSYTFSLTIGRFIDPAQIGDDPEAFRVQAGQMLIAKAESLGEDYTAGFWDNYAEIISHWNDTTVIFDESGMLVIFSAYELGPYAMGPVELRLTYEELAGIIGEGGLAQLGVTPEKPEE